MREHLFHWIAGGGAALLLSAAARALPEPLPLGSRVYLWFYNFAGILLSNFDRITVSGKK